MAILPDGLKIIRPAKAFFYNADFEHSIPLRIDLSKVRLAADDSVFVGTASMRWSVYQPYASGVWFRLPVPITQWLVDLTLWRGPKKRTMRLVHDDLYAAYSTGNNVRRLTEFEVQGGLVRRVHFPLVAIMGGIGWDDTDDVTAGWHGHEYRLTWDVRRVRTLEHLGGSPVRHVTTGVSGEMALGRVPVPRPTSVFALLEDEDRLREEILGDEGHLFRAAAEVPVQPLPALWSDDAQIDYIFALPGMPEVTIDVRATAAAILVSLGMALEQVPDELHDATTLFNEESGEAAHPVNELLGLPIAAARWYIAEVLGVGSEEFKAEIEALESKGDLEDAMYGFHAIRGALADFLMSQAATQILTVYVSRLGHAVTSAGRAMKAAPNIEAAWQELHNAGSDEVEPTTHVDRQLSLEYYRSILLAQLEREEDNYDYSGWLPRRRMGSIAPDAHETGIA